MFKLKESVHFCFLQINQLEKERKLLQTVGKNDSSVQTMTPPHKPEPSSDEIAVRLRQVTVTIQLKVIL